MSAFPKNTSQALRLYHTVRYLKPSQITHRLYSRVRRVAPNLAPAPNRRRLSGTWCLPPFRPQSLFGNGRVIFLNRQETLTGATDWNSSKLPKLWLYNLHYFDDLTSDPSSAQTDKQRRFLKRWIEENPPGTGNGWEPYPTSLRIVNWIKWALRGEEFDEAMRHSLAIQARWLGRHLEWHLLGNHLMANAKAMIFAGLFFDGPQAQAWLETGQSILERQLPEQILPDGGHFELSPMYHAIILEDLMDILNIARAFDIETLTPFSGLPAKITAMRRWLAIMSHPDGQISFFNDATFGIAPEPAKLDAYAHRLQLDHISAPQDGLTHLKESGYVRVQMAGFVSFLDLADVGATYIPGHAHADTLSFEVSCGGNRVLVNGGTSTYAPGPERHGERATRSHNTVEIDGQNSSEIWAAFRVARRARVSGLHIHETADKITVAASHDGYRRLPGRPLHQRKWEFSDRGLTVSDTTPPAIPATAYVLLAPDVHPKWSPGADVAKLHCPDATSLMLRFSSAPRIENRTWSCGFSRRQPSSGFAFPLKRGYCQMKLERA